MQVTEKELEDYERVLKESGRGDTLEYIKQVIKSAGSSEEKRLRKRFCANELWYRVFKPMAVNWVGWDSKWEEGYPEHEFLKSSDAYDAVYSVWYNQLPDCGPECGCARR